MIRKILKKISRYLGKTANYYNLREEDREALHLKSLNNNPQSSKTW